MQRVVLQACNSDTTVSEWKAVKFVVPQGSVLGSLSFNVHINDFPDTLKDIACTILYADNTTTTVTSKDLNSLNDKLNIVMRRVSSWFQNNNLVPNKI
jgi:hypothetical protein